MLRSGTTVRRATVRARLHYYADGNTKVYGACLPRFRMQDF
jgi:hypothetical protein